MAGLYGEVRTRISELTHNHLIFFPSDLQNSEVSKEVKRAIQTTLNFFKEYL